MSTYLVLNHSRTSRSQLAHYLQRTGWLTVGQSGSFSEEMLRCVQSGSAALVFLRLADPDETIPAPFLAALRGHPGLIVSSPYPRQLFQHLELQPVDFLTEPYSFERFAACLQTYVEREE